MSHVPNIEKSKIAKRVPSHQFLDSFVPEKGAFWQSPDDVVVDEFENFLLLGVLLESRVLDVGVDHDEIVSPFAGERLILVVLVGGHVFEQKPPAGAPVV